MLDNFILFLSLKGFPHLNKGANLVPRHVLKKNVVFKGNHDATFGLLSFWNEIVCRFGLLLVKKDSRAALELSVCVATGFLKGGFLLIVYGKLVD
jgi:hypothetical protein